VKYGTTTSYTSSTVVDNTQVTSHSVNLSGLTASTLYHYQVLSGDAAGNLTASGDFTFTTPAPRTTPPVITNVQATAITSSGATITWTTDEPADSTVKYGTTSSYGSSTPENSTLVTNHSMNLTGLLGNTLYHYQAVSIDSFNNTGTSTDFTFTTSPSAPFSLWSATTTPNIAAQNDSNSIEVGLKFKSDIAGYITAIRFYKGTTNTGTHIGNLWTSSGTLLESVTFTGETASGWQQATFSTPILISANTVYVASYFAAAGHYAIDAGYFASAGFDNTTLHALQDGVSGGNGVFLYSAASAFPTNTSGSANYWVDVVFAQTPQQTGVTVAPTSFTLTAAGATQQLTTTATYSDGSTQNVTSNAATTYKHGRRAHRQSVRR